MSATIKYFGQIAECTGRNTERLDVNGITVKALIDKLQLSYPDLANLEFTVAVDQSIAALQTVLTQNSEVALLPPFSGG